MDWSVYILRCSDGSYYVGYSNDAEKRLKSHNAWKGAKYTRSRLPCEIVYTEQFTSKHEAMSREYQVKNMNRTRKQALIDRQSSHAT
mgnify:CR=1 FL=1